MKKRTDLSIPNPRINNGSRWGVFPDRERDTVLFTNPNDQLAAVVRKADDNQLEVSRLAVEDVPPDIQERIEAILTNVAETALAGGKVSLE